MPSSRRHFLRRSAVSAAFLGLSRFSIRSARAEEVDDYKYGDVIPDPQRIFDLPAGFSYKVIGRSGDFMDDEFRLPGRTDGMGAFPGPDGRTILVRNHELEKDMTFFGPFGLQNELLEKVDPSLVYDAGQRLVPQIGGTTTVVYDPKTQLVEKQFLSLAGTCRNCAGGQTPWNSWLSCEETVDKAGSSEDPENKNERSHGWVFEVPATSEVQLAKPTPFHPPPLRSKGGFKALPLKANSSQ